MRKAVHFILAWTMIPVGMGFCLLYWMALLTLNDMLPSSGQQIALMIHMVICVVFPLGIAVYGLPFFAYCIAVTTYLENRWEKA